MANNNRERGESSSTKVDKSGILRWLARNIFCYQPAIDATSYNEYTPSRWTSRNLGDIVMFPSSAELLSSYERQNGEVRSMAAGPEGLLYTSSDSINIRVWSQGKLSGGFHAYNGPNYALLLDTQGRVFTASNDGRVRVWVKGVGPTNPPSFVHIRTLPSLEDRSKEKVWRKKMKVTGKFERMNWHSFSVTCMSFSKVSEDILYLYTGSTDHSIKVWSLKDWTLVDCLKGHKQIVSAVAAGCNSLMFSGSQDGSVLMWLRQEKQTEKNGIYHTVLYTLLSGTNSVNVLFLKSKTKGFATEAGAELYAGLSDGRVLFWKETVHFASSGIETLAYHKEAVTCLAGSPGTLVFSGSRDGMICAWSNAKGTRDCIAALLHCCS